VVTVGHLAGFSGPPGTDESSAMRVVAAVPVLLIVVSACAANPRPVTRHGGLERNAPRTLDEAVTRLRNTLSPETLERLRTSDESVVHELHFGVGLSIRNGWGLWTGGPLYNDLTSLGLQHADDMSGLLFTCLWRSIHGVPWRVEEEVRLYQAYWRAATHPDPKSNPQCATGVVITQSYDPDFNPAASRQLDLRLRRQVHLGKCCKDGRLWAYEGGRGWFPADPEHAAVWRLTRSRAMTRAGRVRERASLVRVHSGVLGQRRRRRRVGSNLDGSNGNLEKQVGVEASGSGP
jgi:hypothetical protein